MATDVDIQFFSHLNGLVLSNNWGDMIRLLDTCLVSGLPLASITSASIDSQGDISLNLFAGHKCLLLQVVELSGFEPMEINGKYRIKGAPTTTQLILKAVHAGKTITKIGSAKLASLGYDIIFSDGADVKRVYRAKNPRAEHPFIRVDETISDGTNTYTSTYAKSAMVGLLENMTHIDDYGDSSKLQLPLDTTNFEKNWKIAGTGTSCVRGWSKWYWATSEDAAITSMAEINKPAVLNRSFTLTGNSDAFYILNSRTGTGFYKLLNGAGLFEKCVQTLQYNWFLMSLLRAESASATTNGPYSLTGSTGSSKFLITSPSINLVSNHALCSSVQPTFASGRDTLFNGGNIGALEIPIYDSSAILRGVLPIVAYSGKSYGDISATMPLLSDNSMYVYDALTPSGNGSGGGVYFYLGELA